MNRLFQYVYIWFYNTPNLRHHLRNSIKDSGLNEEEQKLIDLFKEFAKYNP